MTDSTELGTGALWHEPQDMDQRDYLASDILAEADLVEKSVSYTKALLQTTHQSCVPSCTAHSLCHVISIQNILEEKTQEIFVDPKDQWESNQWRKTVCSWRWDYLEVALEKLRQNGVKGTVRGKPFVFKITWTAFESWTSRPYPEMFGFLAGRLRQVWPLYVAFRGNSKIYNECSAGEIKTFFTLAETDWGHAVALTGINFEKKELEFINSWNVNTDNIAGEKKLSSFKISFDLFARLVAGGIFGRRYFIAYDDDNMLKDPLFIDYAEWNSKEDTEAVTRAKENGLVIGVKKPNWQALEPYANITRLQVILIMYRFWKWVLKQLGK